MTLKTHKRVTYCFIILIPNLFLVKLAKLMINALSVKQKKKRICIAPNETLVIETHTCPYLVLNGNNHKVHSHEKVGHCEIRQKTGLNRVVVAPNQTPGYNSQVTKHRKNTEQPNYLSRTSIMRLQLENESCADNGYSQSTCLRTVLLPFYAF